MYIENGSKERRDGKVKLLVSSMSELVNQYFPIDPMAEGNIVHLVFSMLLKECGPKYDQIQTLKSVAISLDLRSGEFWGPYDLHVHNANPAYDVSDWLHKNGYVDVVLKARGADEEKRRELSLQVGNTGFLARINYDNYRKIAILLEQVRHERILHRAANSRDNRDHKFPDDFIDQALAEIFKKVNALMGNLLYWGQGVHDELMIDI